MTVFFYVLCLKVYNCQNFWKIFNGDMLFKNKESLFFFEIKKM